MWEQLLQLFAQGGNTAGMAENLAAMASPGGLDQMIQASATPAGITPDMVPGQNMMLTPPTQPTPPIPQVPNAPSWDVIVPPAPPAVAAAAANAPKTTDRSFGLTPEQIMQMQKLMMGQQDSGQAKVPGGHPPQGMAARPPGAAQFQAPLAGGRPPTLGQLIYGRR